MTKKLLFFLAILGTAISCFDQEDINIQLEPIRVVDDRLYFSTADDYIKSIESLNDPITQAHWQRKYNFHSLNELLQERKVDESFAGIDSMLTELPTSLTYILNKNGVVQIGNTVKVYKNNYIFKYTVEEYNRRGKPYDSERPIMQMLDVGTRNGSNARQTFQFQPIYFSPFDIVLNEKYKMNFSVNGKNRQYVQQLYFYSEVNSSGSNYNNRWSALYVRLKLLKYPIPWNAPEYFQYRYSLVGDAIINDGAWTEQINITSPNYGQQWNYTCTQSSCTIILFTSLTDPSYRINKINLGLTGQLYQAIEATPTVPWDHSFVY